MEIIRDVKTVGPWAMRMLLLALGGWLTRAGVGDAELWGGLTDILAGPLVLAGTAVWSWRDRGDSRMIRITANGGTIGLANVLQVEGKIRTALYAPSLVSTPFSLG